MDVSVVWDVLNNYPWIPMVIVIGGVGIATLVYTIIRDHGKRRRKDREYKENTRNALKRIYEELEDTFDAIKADKGVHNYRDRVGGKTVLFLKIKFWHAECEDLIKSPEVRSTDLDVNTIKDAVGIIKENNRIFDWMEHNQPPVNEDGNIPLVEHDMFPNMLEECTKMHTYQERLREDIPLILQKIRDVCDRLD